MMRLTISHVLMLLLPTAFGFKASILPRSSIRSGWGLLASSRSSSTGGSTSSSSPTAEGDNQQHHIEYNPMAGYQGVDLDRAKECAEHFGECTVDEMALLRENLHKERMQRFMFGTVDPRDTMREMEDSLEHRLLEEELDLQLSLLRDQNELHGGAASQNGGAASMLFPRMDDFVDEVLPQRHHNRGEHDREAVEVAELTHALEETVLEESNLEAIALCAGIAILLVFPHLLQL